MMQKALSELLERRRNKVIAIILSVKERECDQHLPAEASAKLRKVVLDQLNEWHSLVLDVVASIDTGEAVVNEEYLKKLDEIHAVVMGGKSGEST